MPRREQLASPANSPLEQVPYQHEAAEQVANGSIQVEMAESTLASLNQLVADMGERGEDVSPTILMEASQDEGIQSTYNLEPITALQAVATLERMQSAKDVKRDTIDKDTESAIEDHDSAREKSEGWSRRSIRETEEPQIANFAEPLTRGQVASQRKDRRQRRLRAKRERLEYHKGNAVKGTSIVTKGTARKVTFAKTREIRQERREEPGKLAQQRNAEQAEANWQTNRKTKLSLVGLPSNQVAGKEAPILTRTDSIVISQVHEALSRPDKLQRAMETYQTRLVPEIEEVYDQYKQTVDETVGFYSKKTVPAEYHDLFTEDGLADFHTKLQERLKNSIESAYAHNPNLTQTQAEQIEAKVLERASLRHLKAVNQNVPGRTQHDFSVAYQEFLNQQAQYKAVWDTAERTVIQHYTGSRAEAWAVLNVIRQVEARQERTRHAGRQAGRIATAGAGAERYSRIDDLRADPELQEDLRYLDQQIGPAIQKEVRSRKRSGGAELPRDEFRTLTSEVRLRVIREFLGGDDADDEEVSAYNELYRHYSARSRR